ncbi:MAG TPA: CoA transferase [Acidimicrobiales bacterium]|nr:CoA transferase [Acidimicrobiales bacterium]
MSSTEAPLSGWVVADLSIGIAGGYCTKMLADGGAEVVKVEPPEGDPLRTWSASGAAIPDGDDGALFQFLAASKRSVVVDPGTATNLAELHELLETADAVVWTPGSSLADLEVLRPAALLREHPHLTVTTITPFGLDGPWRDRPATEFTLQAWSGGVIGLGRGDPERAPVFVGGQVGAWLAGAYGAVGTMVSCMRGDATDATGDATGAGEIVDVSMLEALAMCLTYYPVTYFDALGRPFRGRRSIVTPGVGMAKDGMVAVGVGTGQQWLDFCVLVGHPEWTQDRSLFRERSHLAPVVDEWFAGHTVDEIRDLAGAFRLPNAPIANGENLPHLDHFDARGTFVANPSGGFLQPESPYRMHPAALRPPEPAPPLGRDTGYRAGGRRARPEAAAASPFAGMRVLDMTAFWAGPSCTHPLAMLGAEVIHLESTGRPDGTRMLGAPMTEEQWWERSPIFSGINTNKKSLTLDFQSERGMDVLRRLIATVDVVVENYTPRVLDNAGLGFDALRALRDDIILVRMPGFGLDGPWRDNAAFAYTIEDASGFTWMTGHPDQKPLEPYCVGDPNAGIHALAGLLLALVHRRRTGEGVFVEAAMVDAAVNVTAEQVIEYSAYGSLLERAGNRGPGAAPQNLYRTADTDERGGNDSWVAIAVEDDGQWEALVDVLGRPEWATGAPLSSAAGRAEQHDLIDERLSAWCAQRTGDDVVAALWPAGVPVAKVMQPHRQGELEQLRARGYFEVVEHPVSGAARHGTLPMRLSRGPQRLHRRHAPLLGEHNTELLGELGLTTAEIAELEDEGVIGRAPA